jgi:hypothetical protein
MNSSGGAGSATTSPGVRDAAAWIEQSPPPFRGTGFALHRGQPGGLAGLDRISTREDSPMQPPKTNGGGGCRHLTAAASAFATEG